MSRARVHTVNISDNMSDDLLLNLIEQVKMPFVQIAYAAELLQEVTDLSQIERGRKSIAMSSQAALCLIDGYLLSVALQREGQLQFEPVSISSVLYDSAQILTSYARAHNCELQIQVGGKYEPVMAHREAVQAAIVSLGFSFIEATMHQESEQRAVVQLAVKRTGTGICTGVFSSNTNLSSTLFSQAKRLHGKVHQPLGRFDSGNSSGIFIADALFNRLDTEMKVARSQGLPGLAATLLPSRQLHLV